MQTRNRILDDLARVASGAMSAVTGSKDEADGFIKARLERLLDDMDLVPRDEFEAVKEMAAKARAEQEKLEQRVADLEAQLAAGKAGSKAQKKTK